MATIRMRDYISGPTKDLVKVQQHKLIDSSEKGVESLLVYVAATHAGKINGNSRFYRPDRMQESVHTWTPKKGYARPVLIGHDEDANVLGRVMSAKYVDESHQYSVNFPIVRDSVFYKSAADKRMGLYESIDWIVGNLQDADDYSGLGYIELGLKLTNPDAIQKVLRDEYLTVSVGFKTDSAVCSICHTDWAQEDKCEHKMGDDYDGKKMFIISGKFEYDELSFVNFPADPFAGVISKEKLADSLQRYSRESWYFLGLSDKERDAKAPGVKMTDSVLGHDIEFEVEDMAIAVVNVNDIDPVTFDAEIKDDKLTQEKAQELKKQVQTWQPETDELKAKKRSLVSTLNAKIKKNGWDKKVDAEKTTGQDEIEALIECSNCAEDEEVTWTDDELTEEDKVFFSDVDGIYAEMEAELDAATTDGELDASVVKDAKLSSEARGKLKGGTFCGPGRSFPVPDCAHVTAARRLIGRAKVSSSTKAKILSCVSRKASSLSCGGKKDAVIPYDEAVAKMIAGNDKLTDAKAKPALDALNSLDKAYSAAEDEDKGIIRSATSVLVEHWSVDGYLTYLKSHLEEKDFAVLPKSDLADKETALNTLTDEKADLEKKLDVSEQIKGKLLSQIKKNYASQVVMYRVLKGADGFKDLTIEQVTVKVDELSKRHVTSLKDSVADIMSELKWNDAVITTTEAPHKEEVKEPVQVVNDNVQVTEPGVATEKSPAVLAEEAMTKALQFRDALRYMTEQERRTLLLSRSYEDAKAANNTKN